MGDISSSFPSTQQTHRRVRDHIFTVSSEVLQSITGKGSLQAEVLVHGIDLEATRALRSERTAVRNELGFNDKQIVIGTIANFREQKDYPNLLGALVKLRENGTDFHCLAVGHGPLFPEMVELARNNSLTECLTFLGPRRDAVRILSGCDIFVLASKWEGLPVAVMEALALGLPLVATDVGGIHEKFKGEQGISLVQSKNSQKLANELRRVIESQDLRKQMSESSTRLSSHFDCKTPVQRIETVYKHFLGERLPEIQSGSSCTSVS